MKVLTDNCMIKGDSGGSATKFQNNDASTSLGIQYRNTFSNKSMSPNIKNTNQARFEFTVNQNAFSPPITDVRNLNLRKFKQNLNPEETSISSFVKVPAKLIKTDRDFKNTPERAYSRLFSLKTKRASVIDRFSTPDTRSHNQRLYHKEHNFITKDEYNLTKNVLINKGITEKYRISNRTNSKRSEELMADLNRDTDPLYNEDMNYSRDFNRSKLEKSNISNLGKTMKVKPVKQHQIFNSNNKIRSSQNNKEKLQDLRSYKSTSSKKLEKNTGIIMKSFFQQNLLDYSKNFNLENISKKNLNIVSQNKCDIKPISASFNVLKNEDFDEKNLTFTSFQFNKTTSTRFKKRDLNTAQNTAMFSRNSKEFIKSPSKIRPNTHKNQISNQVQYNHDLYNDNDHELENYHEHKEKISMQNEKISPNSNYFSKIINFREKYIKEFEVNNEEIILRNKINSVMNHIMKNKKSNSFADKKNKENLKMINSPKFDPKALNQNFNKINHSASTDTNSSNIQLPKTKNDNKIKFLGQIYSNDYVKKPTKENEKTLFYSKVLVVAYNHIFKDSLLTIKHIIVQNPRINSQNLDLKKKVSAMKSDDSEVIKAFRTNIRKKLSLSNKYEYLYSLNGNLINNITDISSKDKTLLISSYPDFNGVFHKKYFNKDLKEQNIKKFSKIEKYINQIKAIEKTIFVNEKNVFSINPVREKAPDLKNKEMNLIFSKHIVAVMDESSGERISSKQLKGLCKKLDLDQVKYSGVKEHLIKERLKSDTKHQELCRSVLVQGIAGKMNQKGKNIDDDGEVIHKSTNLQMFDTIESIYENQHDFQNSMLQRSLANNVFFNTLGNLLGIKKKSNNADPEKKINISELIIDTQKKKKERNMTSYSKKDKFTMMGLAQEPLLKKSFGDKYRITKVTKQQMVICETEEDKKNKDIDQFSYDEEETGPASIPSNFDSQSEGSEDKDSDNEDQEDTSDKNENQETTPDKNETLPSNKEEQKQKPIDENKKKNFKRYNALNVLGSKSLTKKVSIQHGNLVEKNIHFIKRDAEITRNEIIQYFVLFKALCEISAQRLYQQHKNDKHNLVDKLHKVDGVDYPTLCDGMFQIGLQNEEILKRVFFSIDTKIKGYLDWGGFISCVIAIRSKSLSEKIDLFVNIADEDGNGQLSWDEIYALSRLCLQKYISVKNDDTFLEDLATYFSKLQFETCEVDIDEEIPFDVIKDLILNNHPNSGLLCMFCGADK